MHLAEEDEFISKSAQAEIKTALARKPNSTIYSYPDQRTPSLGITGRTTMPRRQRSPTGGQANFYIDNCGDLRPLQPVLCDWSAFAQHGVVCWQAGHSVATHVLELEQIVEACSATNWMKRSHCLTCRCSPRT
jgi:hypothetical protein